MIEDYSQRTLILIALLLFHITSTPIDTPALATLPDDTKPSSPWYLNIDDRWGGHLKVCGSVSWPSRESFYQPVGAETLYDGHTEVRIKNRLFFGDWGNLEAHYEWILSGGDTRHEIHSLERLYPDLFADGPFFGSPLEDDRRFMDLTKTISEDEGHILYHRLDRLALSLLPDWGTVKLGRQAVTWGNGLLFNPMDLFNPFSPADIERDYKVGDDMVLTQFPLNTMGELQFLYVPRRDPFTKGVEWDHSSLAGKAHFARETTEYDIMVADHCGDEVVGLGSSGYIGDAAWRLDGTWTFLHSDGGYLSVVANMDYSWTWRERNWYGFLELYFNGLSHNQYLEAYTDSEIGTRIQRGELYTLGRTYLSGHIRLELHPLFNVYVTVIENLADPSGGIQPRAVWDIAEDAQITFGGAIYHGRRGTEYGGVTIRGTNLIDRPPGNAFLWLTYFF
jgi:hypothetical protein